MGLKETLKETKDKLEEVLAEDKKSEETALETLNKTVAEAIEEPKKEETKDEDKSTDVKEEVKAEEKPVEEKTASEHAKERIAKKNKVNEELAAANARIAALEASINRAVEPKKEVVADNEPNPATNPVEWTAWKTRQLEAKIENLAGWKAEQDVVKKREILQQQAENEVTVYENKLRPLYPDYDDVKNYYVRMLAASIKIVNPKITQNDLVKTVNNRLLTRASELMNEGYENPVEAMYFEAKQLGYQPPVSKEEKEEKEIKPDLDKVAKFKKRNAGMAGAGGSGGESDVITPVVASKMTNAEFARLKPEQKKRLFASLRG